MDKLIPIDYADPERPTVSGREIHEFLQVDSNYTTWFKRMVEYGFTEGKDYVPILENRSDGLAGKPRTDHQLTIPMAKELCMLQRNERGKLARRYFLAVEEQWNSPEAVMQRAVLLADKKVKLLQSEKRELAAQVEDLTPKATFADAVCSSGNSILIGGACKADLSEWGSDRNPAAVLLDAGERIPDPAAWRRVQPADAEVNGAGLVRTETDRRDSFQRAHNRVHYAKSYRKRTDLLHQSVFVEEERRRQYEESSAA